MCLFLQSIVRYSPYFLRKISYLILHLSFALKRLLMKDDYTPYFCGKIFPCITLNPYLYEKGWRHLHRKCAFQSYYYEIFFCLYLTRYAYRLTLCRDFTEDIFIIPHSKWCVNVYLSVFAAAENGKNRAFTINERKWY